MIKPIIMTDASCDLPREFIMENKIPFLGLICHFKGKDYEDDFGQSLSYEDFYNGLREGEMPYTAQINEFRFTEKFKELLVENRPIIYIGMSSGLSGTFNSAKLAKEEVLREIGEGDITVIDTKCSSIGQGILVYHAHEMAERGCSKEEIVDWVENNKMNVNLWFVVEDLNHLKRGGRISASKAAIGTLLNIKPIICIVEDGTLKNITSIRGKKRAVKYIIDKFKERAVNPKEQLIGISHGDCLEEAEALKELIKSEFGSTKFVVNKLGTGMAAHCGAGMLSLCFIGKERDLI